MPPEVALRQERELSAKMQKIFAEDGRRSEDLNRSSSSSGSSSGSGEEEEEIAAVWSEGEGEETTAAAAGTPQPSVETIDLSADDYLDGYL
jgi:hypothetical protein